MKCVPDRNITKLASTVLALGCGLSAVSATAEPVKLVSQDGNVQITGDLLSFENEIYLIKTALGNMRVSAADMACEGGGCPDLGPKVIIGEMVQMQTPDGSLTVTGKLLAFENDQYVVETSLGKIRAGVNEMICSGPGCPSSGAPKETLVASIAPTAPFDPATVDVRFAGSDTVGLGLMPYLMEGYADYLNARDERIQVSEIETLDRFVGNNGSGRVVSEHLVVATGSGDAFDALAVKAAEFGMTSRRVKSGEAAEMLAAGAGVMTDPDHETVIAVDSLAVIVHPDNPVTGLTFQQIGGMYLGRITNWAQVGGKNAPITVISREDGSSTRGVFEKAVFSGQEPPLAARVVYPEGDNPEIAAAVQNDPNAIGYVGFAYSEGLKRLDLTSSCGITSTATPFAVKTEEYPLGRRLYLYHRPDNMPQEARNFLQYVLSPEADDAIARSSFVNFGVERVSQAGNTSRANTLFNGLNGQTELGLANDMLNDMRSWDRLSTTVRFPTGSSALGQKELNDVDRLVSYLEGLPDGSQVAIVGFTDSVGSFSRNLFLSNQRALSVARSIDRVAGSRLTNVEFQTKSYSELAPSVCEIDDNGRAINRRVEVWVRKAA